MDGERLRRLRKSAGISQEELGKKMGSVKQTVSNWEVNKYTPDYETVCKLARFFDVSVDYLMGHTDDPGTQPAAVGPSLSEEELQLLDAFNSSGRKDMLKRLIDFWGKLDPVYQDVLLGKAAEMSLSSNDGHGSGSGTGTLGK